MILRELREGLNRLPRLGKQHAAALASMGVDDCGALMQHYPSSYQDRRQRVLLNEQREQVNTVVRVKGHQFLQTNGGRLLKIVVEDESGEAALVCFHRAFLSRQLLPGNRYFLAGSFYSRYGEWQSSQFDFEPYSEQPRSFGRILPIYRLAGKLRQKNMRDWVSGLLETHLLALEDELPLWLRERRGLVAKGDALRGIHFPSDDEHLRRARRALIYEELFHFMLLVAYRRFQRLGHPRPARELMLGCQRELIARLPFRLTTEQHRVLAEINHDLAASLPMQRLLHGDVGCGKTVVALLSALPVLERGGQVALMAPTEVLARQLYRHAGETLQGMGVRCAFLSGQLTEREKKVITADLEGGDIALVVGTHALFSQRIAFRDLGLVIIDEQHRFGVAQRLAIRDKGHWPDLLLMSATPIPRTLGLTVYGDLSVSTIRRLPATRLPVLTHLAEWGSIRRVYRFVEEELKQGRQAYFIYPRVFAAKEKGKRSVEEMAEELRRRFCAHRVGVIHGQLKEQLKQQVMDDFLAHRLDVLAASTVIEVGVDVANATVMVVDNAPCFGLAQLHQLRGRVGRGKHQSYCFFIYPPELSEDAVARLRVLKESNDGFHIAERDFQLRGPGELLGTRQSGYPALHLADLQHDRELLLEVRKDVFSLLKDDAELMQPQNRSLQRSYGGELGSYERIFESG